MFVVLQALMYPLDRIKMLNFAVFSLCVCRLEPEIARSFIWPYLTFYHSDNVFFGLYIPENNRIRELCSFLTSCCLIYVTQDPYLFCEKFLWDHHYLNWGIFCFIRIFGA